MWLVLGNAAGSEMILGTYSRAVNGLEYTAVPEMLFGTCSRAWDAFGTYSRVGDAFGTCRRTWVALRISSRVWDDFGICSKVSNAIWLIQEGPEMLLDCPYVNNSITYFELWLSYISIFRSNMIRSYKFFPIWNIKLIKYNIIEILVRAVCSSISDNSVYTWKNQIW